MTLTLPFKAAANACSPGGHILGVRHLDKELIAMFHSSPANTGFNFITQVPIPNTKPICYFPWSFRPPAFSADGMKFAVAANDGTVSVWYVQNKIPLMVKEPDCNVCCSLASLKFSSGTLGRGVLAFLEVSQLCLDVYFLHVE